jgi:hypothetical protein
VHPEARHRPMPGSGPRRHDTRQRLIAPIAYRETSIPASHHYCPGASKAARDAGDDAKIAPSTAAAATNFLPRSAIRRRLPRPAQPRPNTLPRQISIDARLLTQPPRVPSWEAFGSRPSVRLERSRSAGIRNPAPKRALAPVDRDDGPCPETVIPRLLCGLLTQHRLLVWLGSRRLLRASGRPG